jgi:hypothetical protein
MSNPICMRAYIDNKKVTNRVYFAGSEDDEVVKIKKQVTDVFTSETFPYEVQTWGVDTDGNVLTFHQCSCDPDYKDSDKMQNSILIDRDFLRYIYKELVSVSLYTHLERYQVYGEGNSLYVEYTCDFADEITNLADTEIVLPKTDNHGNRIAQSVNKANIGEYVKVPKSDGSGGYDKVLLKDL